VNNWLSKYGGGPLVRGVHVIIFLPMIQLEGASAVLNILNISQNMFFSGIMV